LDSSCCRALLTVASPALPPPLTALLERWDELDDEQRERARGDLRMLAVLMRRAR
jgi:hypothetical protein